MIDVALVTCVDLPDGTDDDHLLAAALTATGRSVSFVCWDDPEVQWPVVGAALVRSTWDYHRRVDAFCGWADWVGSVTRLHNPAATIRWNAHKGYLLELAAAGVPVVPTTLVRAGSTAVPTIGDDDVVIKPAVSIGAERTVRHATQTDLDELVAATDTLVQPYLAAITDGELSIVCVGGEPSHVVRKVPKAGDFRTQEHHGAVVEPVDLDDELAAFGRLVTAAVPGPVPTVARVDAVRTDDGLLLMEVELIEPALWLAHAPATVERLVAALGA